MQKITDRELLTFCSLAKLKLEFSQYTYKELGKEGKEITKYKTLSQLIDEELEGQKNRENIRLDDELGEEYQKELEKAQEELRKLEEEKIVYEENINEIGKLKSELEELTKDIPKISASREPNNKLVEAGQLRDKYKQEMYNSTAYNEDYQKVLQYITYLSPIKEGKTFPMDYTLELSFLDLQG